MSPRSPPAWLRHLSGIVLVALAAAASYALADVVPGTGYALFALAIGLAAWFGGRDVGLVAAVLATLAAAAGDLRTAPFSSPMILAAALRLACGCALAWIVSALHRARAVSAAQLAAHDAAQRSINNAVIFADAQGRVTYMNPAAEALTGVQATSMAARLDAIFGVADVAGVLADSAHSENELLLLRADGTARLVTATATRTAGRDGRVAQLVIVLRESRPLTPASANAAGALDHGIQAASAGAVTGTSRSPPGTGRADDAKYLLENLPDLVWMAAPDGTCEWFNRRWAEYAGRPVTDWREPMHPEDREPSIAAWLMARAQATPLEIEARFRRHDGAARWHLVRMQPLRGAGTDPTPRGWYGNCTDIDDQKRASAALRNTQQRMSAFLGTLSHELRNPLATLSAAVQVMRHPRAESDMTGRALETLDRQTALLTRMVEELLDAARLMDGRIDLQRRCVSLNELLHEVCADLSTRAASDNVDLHCEVPETKISIDGDLLRIKQAVENIVRNALDACSGGGSVHVSVIAGGVGEAGIRIADSGRGLSAEDLATLFEPGKSPGLHNGLGLGLKTVHRIVQLHGGRVVARSDGPGTGATFELYFPLFDTRAVIGADPTAAQRSQLIGQRVLIIAGGTDALVAPLEHCGAEVRRAASGFEGIRTAASWSPTAVVCDLDLPSPLTGCDVARQIAAQTAQRPRLIAIGDAGRVDVAAARNAGFDDCLARPIALPRLLATLAQAATFVAAGATA